MGAGQAEQPSRAPSCMPGEGARCSSRTSRSRPLACRTACPLTTTTISRATKAITHVESTEKSYRVFTTPRSRDGVRRAPRRALREWCSFIDSSGLLIQAPVEVRFVAADDIPCSMAAGREQRVAATSSRASKTWHATNALSRPAAIDRGMSSAATKRTSTGTWIRRPLESMNERSSRRQSDTAVAGHAVLHLVEANEPRRGEHPVRLLGRLDVRDRLRELTRDGRDRRRTCAVRRAKRP